MDGTPKDIGVSPTAEEIHSFGKDTTVALGALRDFLSIDEFDGLWQRVITYSEHVEADLLSYHHHAPDFAPGQENVSVRTHGFPTEWVSQYIETRQHLTDPITRVFAARIRPMRWSQVDKIVSLTAPQAEYLASLRSWMTGDGIGFPLFGPGGRHGYVGIGRSSRPINDWGMLQTHRMHWVMQSFHMRWCELVLMKQPVDFTLNTKELRVLESIAMGMQDEVICGVVGAQLDSVEQTIRGMMRKMNVSDRRSAILRGIGAGLLDNKSAVLEQA